MINEPKVVQNKPYWDTGRGTYVNRKIISQVHLLNLSTFKFVFSWHFQVGGQVLVLCEREEKSFVIRLTVNSFQETMTNFITTMENFPILSLVYNSAAAAFLFSLLLNHYWT